MKLLVKNELVKILKQTGFRIMLIIFACLIVAIPLLNRALYSIGSLFSFDGYGADADYYLETANWSRSEGDATGWAFYTGIYDMMRFFDENGMTYEDAQYEIYSTELENAYSVRAAMTLLSDGTYGSWEELMENDYWNICFRILEIMETEGIPYGGGTEDGEKAGVTPLPETVEKASLDALSAALPGYISSIEKSVREFDMGAYYSGQAGQMKDYLESAKAEAEAAKAAYELAPEQKRDALRYEYEYRKSEAESADCQYRALRYLADKVPAYKGWEYRTAVGIICRAAMSLPGYTDADAETYASDPQYKNYLDDDPMTYEEYLEENRRNREDARQAIAMAEYSLEHGTPLPSALGWSGRAQWQSQVTIAMSWGAIILIVLAGTTLSSEYSSGTIRLLLIRPKKRYKILLSKILAICAVWGCMAVASYAGLFLLNLAFAPGDMFVSDLFWIGGKTVEISPLLHTFTIMLEDMLASSVYVSFALLLSSLIHRAALSIALPIIAREIASTVQFAAISLKDALGKWIVWTPFPYSEFTVFRTDPTADYLYGSDLIGSLMGELYPYSLIKDFSVPAGLCWLAAFCALWTALTFVSFRKQQIKN